MYIVNVLFTPTNVQYIYILHTIQQHHLKTSRSIILHIIFLTSINNILYTLTKVHYTLVIVQCIRRTLYSVQCTLYSEF